MQITPRERLLHYADLLQGTLFGVLEAALGPLTERARLLIAVLEMVNPAMLAVFPLAT